jgi:TolB-like protein
VTGRKLNYILVGLLIVAVGYIIVLQFIVNKPSVQTEVASTTDEQTSTVADVEAAPKTIAVLPFADLSPGKDQEYFVDGLSEELLNCLAKISGLRVTSRTSSFAFKNTDKTLQAVAGVLGVEHILEGSVRKAGDALRITAQLIRVEDDFHLWSETYDRELKDIFDLQEEIAIAVSNELKVKLGIGETFKQLGGTDNVEAYELYLAAKGQLYNPGGETWLHAFESIKAATEIDPEFALAWTLKGFYQAGMVTLLTDTGADFATEMEGAVNAVQKAIELEPDLPEAYAVLGNFNTIIGDWIGAESAFRKMLARKTEHLWGLDLAFATFYQSVGYLEKAKHLFEEIIQNDPLSYPARSFYIINLVSLGDLEGAKESYRRGKVLLGEQWENREGTAIICLANGDILTRDEIDYSCPVTDVVKDLLESPEKALSALHRLYSTGNKEFSFLWSIALWAAYFGDADFAMDAFEKNLTLTNSVWVPAVSEVRQLPRFRNYVREIGLVDYWKQFGWPDLCHPTDDGDFVCD